MKNTSQLFYISLFMISIVLLSFHALEGEGIEEGIEERKIELTAQEILARVDRVLNYPAGQIKGKMVHITPDGRSRVITLTAFIKEDNFLFSFRTPGRGKELKILYNLGGEDIWVYQTLALKLFNKRGIDKFRPVLNTNYSYIDFSNVDFQTNYIAKTMGNVFIKGKNAIMLFLSPIDRSAEYGRLTLYVDIENFVPLRTDYHDSDGILFKTLSIARVIEKGGRIIPVRYDMLHVERGTVTLLEFFSFEEDVIFDKSVFRHQNLGGK